MRLSEHSLEQRLKTVGPQSRVCFCLPKTLETRTAGVYLPASKTRTPRKTTSLSSPQLRTGLHTCRAGLHTCRARLLTCNAELHTCRAEVHTCRARLHTCRAVLYTCRAWLYTCELSFTLAVFRFSLVELGPNASRHSRDTAHQIKSSHSHFVNPEHWGQDQTKKRKKKLPNRAPAIERRTH